MKIEQMSWSAASDWVQGIGPSRLKDSADLVLVFGGTAAIQDRERLAQVQEAYPRAFVFGCSTAGEIQGTTVRDDSIAVTAVEFERTEMRHASVDLRETPDSRDAACSRWPPDTRCQSAAARRRDGWFRGRWRRGR